MSKFSLLVLIIVFYCTSKYQSDCNYITDYYQNVYKADLEFELGNYERAFDLYITAFNSCQAKN